MAGINKSKEFDSRKRKLNENSHSKNLNSGYLDFKQSSRVLKPSSVNNLVEMVRKHTVRELRFGDSYEGANFLKFLQQNVNIRETFTHAKGNHLDNAIDKPQTISNDEIDNKYQNQKTDTLKITSGVLKRKANPDIEINTNDEKAVVFSHLEPISNDVKPESTKPVHVEESVQQSITQDVQEKSNLLTEPNFNKDQNSTSNSSIDNLVEKDILSVAKIPAEYTNDGLLTALEGGKISVVQVTSIANADFNLLEDHSISDQQSNENHIKSIQESKVILETKEELQAHEQPFNESGEGDYEEYEGNDEEYEAPAEYCGADYEEGYEEIEESNKDKGNLGSNKEEIPNVEEIQNVEDYQEYDENAEGYEEEYGEYDENGQYIENYEYNEKVELKSEIQEIATFVEKGNAAEIINQAQVSSEINLKTTIEQAKKEPIVETNQDFEEEIKTPTGEILEEENDCLEDEQIEHIEKEVITLDDDEELVPTIGSNAELSVNIDNDKPVVESFTNMVEDYVNTLTPTLTFHDEPLISEQNPRENNSVENKPLILEKLVQDLGIENENDKMNSLKVIETKSLCDYEPESEDDLPMGFFVEKLEIAQSPIQMSHEQALLALKASKAFEEKVKGNEETVVVPTLHNKVEQDFQEFLDEDECQVFVNRICEPAPGFAVFDTSRTFSFFHYKHLPYLKQRVFEKEENQLEKTLKKLPCCDIISSLIIETKIQDVYPNFSAATMEEFLYFLWKVASCHPDNHVLNKSVEFFKWANQEFSLTWNPSFENILESFINFGAISEDNNCPFKEEIDKASNILREESSHYTEFDENLPSYRMEIKSHHDFTRFPIENFSAILDVLSCFIDKSLQLVDTLVLLIWVSMDPKVRASNLRYKIQKCITNAINKSPELFFGNYVMELSRRLIDLCHHHEDALSLVRGLPAIGKSRELQKLVSFGIIQRLQKVPEIILKRDDTIENLVIFLRQYRISPEMDCHFLHSIISLIEIFVGNAIAPNQRPALRSLSQMLNEAISQIKDNYLNPENGALKTQMTLIKSKWQFNCQKNCDEKKIFNHFCFGTL